MLVGLDLVVLIKLVNSLAHLGMELLYLFHPLVNPPTKLGARKDGSEIKGSAQIGSINHLEWRETRGLTWRHGLITHPSP